MRAPAFTAGSITLAGGRRLAFAELGEPDGLPVLYLHGAIGSPLQPTPDLVAAIERAGVRWICVERPGFGGSSPAPGRTIRCFAADVEALTDALGLERVGVIGVSAGGPYALACGHELAGRVAAVAVCSSLSPLSAPHDVPGMAARMRLPLRLLAAAPGPCTRVLDLAGRALRALEPPPDPGTPVGALRAAVASGAAGLVADYLLSCRPWGFALRDVRVPVDLWHGTRDEIVPVEHAWQLAASLPSCRASFAADEGHFFFRRFVDEIVASVVQATRTGGART